MFKPVVPKCNLSKQCLNEQFPDSFNNYRDAEIVQIKHHWWLKVNFVFGKLRILKNITDIRLIFIEEDFYVLSDLLFICEKAIASGVCDEDKHIFVVGSPSKCSKSLIYISDSVESVFGVLLTREQWKIIKSLEDEFCKYDDYNWDISLVHIMNKFAKFSSCFPLYGSRIIHTGIIGVHNKRLNVVDEISNELFPEKLQFKRRSKNHSKNMYGGWSDPRDITLCNLFSEISE
ncbi:hypothetical protein GJ496_011851 [Pomphorhynchus laevis]|nr:hypothetical protein GJ496_011851 [Pomphorhynchus laevis]